MASDRLIGLRSASLERAALFPFLLCMLPQCCYVIGGTPGLPVVNSPFLGLSHAASCKSLLLH